MKFLLGEIAGLKDAVESWSVLNDTWTFVVSMDSFM
jgi:hypothetical protein